MRTEAPRERLEGLLGNLQKVGYAVAKSPDVWASLSRGGDWDLVVSDLARAETEVVRSLGQPRRVIRRSYVSAYFYQWGEIDLLPGLIWRTVLLASAREIVASARITSSGGMAASPAYQALADWIGPLLSYGAFKERTRDTVRSAVHSEVEVLGLVLRRIFGWDLASRLVSLARAERPEEGVGLRHVLRRAALLRSARSHPMRTAGHFANFIFHEVTLRVDPPLPGLRVSVEDDLERALDWQRDAYPAVPGVVLFDPRRQTRVEMQGEVHRSQLGYRDDLKEKGRLRSRIPMRQRLRLAKDQSRGWLVLVWDGDRRDGRFRRKSLLLGRGTSITQVPDLANSLDAFLEGGSGGGGGRPGWGHDDIATVHRRIGVRFKRRAKQVVGTLALSREVGTRRVILCYHSVHPSAKYRDATPLEFRAQLEYLLATCEVVSLKSLLQAPNGTPANPRPRVALTFDDGYMDNATYVRQILREYGVRATFLVSTGLIDRDAAAMDHMSALRGVSLQSADVMSWENVDELLSDGHELGSHGHSHRNLARLAPGEQAAEITTSRNLLERHLGISPTVFAYPFGKPGVHFTETTKSIVASSGFQIGLAVHFRGLTERSDLLAVPRFTVFRDPITEVRDKVRGGWDIIGAWQTSIPSILRRVVSPEDFAKE